MPKKFTQISTKKILILGTTISAAAAGTMGMAVVRKFKYQMPPVAEAPPTVRKFSTPIENSAAR